MVKNSYIFSDKRGNKQVWKLVFWWKEIIKNLRKIHELDREPFFYIGDRDPHKTKMDIGYLALVYSKFKRFQSIAKYFKNVNPV